MMKPTLVFLVLVVLAIPAYLQASVSDPATQTQSYQSGENDPCEGWFSKKFKKAVKEVKHAFGHKDRSEPAQTPVPANPAVEGPKPLVEAPVEKLTPEQENIRNAKLALEASKKQLAAETEKLGEYRRIAWQLRTEAEYSILRGNPLDSRPQHRYMFFKMCRLDPQEALVTKLNATVVAQQKALADLESALKAKEEKARAEKPADKK